MTLPPDVVTAVCPTLESGGFWPANVFAVTNVHDCEFISNNANWDICTNVFCAPDAPPIINTCDNLFPTFTFVNAKFDSAIGAFAFPGVNHEEFFKDSASRVLYTVLVPVEQLVEAPPK